MKDLFKIYLRIYQKKHIVFSLLAILFLILDVLIALGIPSITKNIFDEINSENPDLNYVYRVGALAVGIAVAAVVVMIVNNVLAQKVATRIAAELRGDLFAKIQELSFSNIDEITTGTLLTVVSNDTAQLQQIILMSFRAILRSPLTLIGAIVMAYLVNQRLFFIILIIVPILTFCIIMILRRGSQYFMAMQERLDDLNTKLNETVSGAREIKAFVTEAQEIAAFDKINERFSDTTISAFRHMASMDPLITHQQHRHQRGVVVCRISGVSSDGQRPADWSGRFPPVPISADHHVIDDAFDDRHSDFPGRRKRAKNQRV